MGLDFAGHDQIKPDASNPPAQSGFAVQGPIILLGTPADNPLIKFVADQRFLPYPPEPESMPVPGRGYVAWQREAIGVNQESTLFPRLTLGKGGSLGANSHEGASDQG